MSAKKLNSRLIERIPKPDAVRSKLARNLRETKLLRQLLKLSEKAAKERETFQGASHAH